MWACGGIALCHARPLDDALAWLTAVILACLAAETLARHGQGQAMRQAILGCALVQVLVKGLQVCGVSGPWPIPEAPIAPWGTLGSETPAGLLLVCAAFWSQGWWRLGAALATCLTRSGTAILPAVLLLIWPWCRTKRLRVLACLLALLGGWRIWQSSGLYRFTMWRHWPLTLWGHGFTAPTMGFQDDSRLGMMWGWRDAHNTYLDWIGRFGLVGGVVLAGVLWWSWQHSRTGAARARWGLMVWCGLWQSVEQFPLLVIPLLVWLADLTQGETHVASL